jgi:threonine/homoserine/homoserine lactone efflux protein
MFELTQIVAYVLVVLVLFLVPGPAVLVTLARSMRSGARVGIATGGGIAVGDMVHTIAATLGLSAILATSAFAFDIVKYAGAAYLVYLGIRAFMERPGDLAVPGVAEATASVAFRQAILIEVLNPKTALFFLSFLPQFVDPARGPAAAQLLVLGAIFVAMSIVYTTLLAFAAAAVAKLIARHRAIGRWQGKVIGSIYLGLGLQLALAKHR